MVRSQELVLTQEILFTDIRKFRLNIFPIKLSGLQALSFLTETTFQFPSQEGPKCWID